METNKSNSNSSENGKVRIILAGGGTGGHIFPAIAIANAIRNQRPDAEILFVGAKGKMEMEKVPQAGYNIKGLDIAGFDRSSLFKNISLPFKLIKSFSQVKNIINEFKPDAAVGVGGYSSFPVLKYAQSKGIATFIHESNSFAGKSNMMLGKNATKIFVAGEGMGKFFPAGKIMITGNPVRRAIVNSTATRDESIRSFGLDPNLKTILAVGGSLGARSINEIMAQHVSELESLNLQLIWQTGRATAQRFIERGRPSKNVWVNDFIHDMDKAYAAADVVISRAGAMSVAELCVAKKPVVFVPYPLAAEDHQTVNAKYLVDRDAALMVKDSEVNAKLFGAITRLATDEALQEKLKTNIAKYAVTNADEIIAKEILALL
ncbi:undecaprenyldiphospho-muramoylpentapeptide beta-N-acetylglucosaminyltransferase [Panacibacter ginsenosidivorans]|uniref:UDP-N-acetylglucosamine--N-acetylmuramyl-(pentapeptide) pyrophosphoryl-undecaprenol N-acetylglucosamine transferase n=1 Tax=Panacibacter ginsenosidivorans TaxID=1813871 RepID=A0A5B8VCZ0_9BACT|nr:undecaprenyldiphospho-muramoylpentapeptide beta-N-acetylglucosaminyltransferase [Panacibacter ginsenosidivorans]QEC68831.1 undecaprenyldiphospho-muramoylpentapeptide beta-N-acetylglucosaminyltransferase [Panacibacter ginsenosidivorans]